MRINNTLCAIRYWEKLHSLVDSRKVVRSAGKRAWSNQGSGLGGMNAQEGGETEMAMGFFERGILVGLVGCVIATIWLSRSSIHEDAVCFPALFSFGSSVADTGSVSALNPFEDPTDSLPYGITYFNRPSHRYCDGRLRIDFWAQALRLPLLSPYVRSVGSNFQHGVNFAFAGSTARKSTTFNPFHLRAQLNHFKAFKRDVLAITTRKSGLKSGRESRLPPAEYFREGLYVIAIGGNDILVGLKNNLTLEEIRSNLPETSQSILEVVEALYTEGARNILIEEVFPQGCIGLILSAFGKNFAAEDFDSAGCLKPFNSLVQYHNSLLRKGVSELNERLPGASIAVIEIFAISHEMISNPAKYGFKQPLKACCGAGGEYNSEFGVPCGVSQTVNGQQVTATACTNPLEHASWDGIHFTEAFHRLTMDAVFTEKYFVPAFQLKTDTCSLAPLS